MQVCGASGTPPLCRPAKRLVFCEFAVGSLPEGYRWLLRLLGLSANLETGLQNLAMAAASAQRLPTESLIYLTMILESYYKKPGRRTASLPNA